jgi:glycosyltransferase involved in cell wall biosynthesis
MRNYSSFLQNMHYQTDLKLFTKLALTKANLITAVSHFTANLVSREMQLDKSRIRVIYNGVDTRLFTPSKLTQKTQTQKISVLFSGNLTHRKGAQWLKSIADRLAKNIAIHYTTGLQPRGVLSGHDQLICLGAIPYQKMPDTYRNADILLFPTVREGFGLAAAEAMACGLPVVATNCSSLPELIDDGKGGFLCPLGDVEDFAEKINHLAENSRLRREMGDYNRAKVEKMFTLEKMIAQYQELFEKVLSK